MGAEEVLVGGAISFAADTAFEMWHALDPEAGGKFPFNIKPFPLPNGDDLIQAVIPLGFMLAKKGDLALGAGIYTGFNLLRMFLINLIYWTRAGASLKFRHRLTRPETFRR